MTISEIKSEIQFLDNRLFYYKFTLNNNYNVIGDEEYNFIIGERINIKQKISMLQKNLRLMELRKQKINNINENR